MAIASSVTTRVAYVPEVTPGTTPATPSFKIARVTKAGDWDPGKSTEKSAELQPDRNVRDEYLLGFDPKASYNFEVTYASLDDFLAGVLQGAWATDVLKNGTTRQFFTFEETLGLGTLNSFSRFPMAMIGSMSLDITARRPITGSMNVMAKQETLDTAIVTGATYAPANTNGVMTASASVGALSVAGVANAKIRRITIDIDNNLATRPVVGSLYSEEFRDGDCDVTGTIEAYFESQALYQKVLNHTGGGLSLTIGQVTAEKYTIDMPNTLFLNGVKRVGGKNDDLIVSIPFRAAYDAGIGASIQITRAVA